MQQHCGDRPIWQNQEPQWPPSNAVGKGPLISDGLKIKWCNCEKLPMGMATILQQESTVSIPVDEDEDEEFAYGEMMYGVGECNSD
jgi:hypothetical protein